MVEVEETDDESSEEENTAVLKLIKKSEKKVAGQKPQPATKVSSFQVSSSRTSVGAIKGSTQPLPAGPPKVDGEPNVPPPGKGPKPSSSEWKPFQETDIVKGSTQDDFQPKLEGKTKSSGQISSVMAERLAMFQGGQKGEPERQEAPRRRLVSNVARLFNRDGDDDDHQEDAKPLPRKSVLSRWVGNEKKEDSAPLRRAEKGKKKEYKRRSDSEEEREQPRRSKDRRRSDDSSGDRHSKGKKGMHGRKSHKSESESESDNGSSHQKKGKGRKQKEDATRHTKEPQNDTAVSSSTNATIDILSQLVMGDTPVVVQPPPVTEDTPLGGDNLLQSLAIQTGLVEPKPDTSLKPLEDLLSLPPGPSVPLPPREQLQTRKASTTGQVEEFPIQEEADHPSTSSKGRSKPQPIQPTDAPTVIDIDIGQEQQILQPRRSKKTSLHMNSANFFVNLPASSLRQSPSIYAPAPLEPLPPPPPPSAGPQPSLPAFIHGSQTKQSTGGGRAPEEIQAHRDALLHQIRSKGEMGKVDQDEVESNGQQTSNEAEQHSGSPFVHEDDLKQSVQSHSMGPQRSSKHGELMHPNGDVAEPLPQDHDPGARNEGHGQRDNLSDKQRRTSHDGEMERDGGRHKRKSSTTRRVDNVDGRGRRGSAQVEFFPDSDEQEMKNNDAEDRTAHRRPSDQHEPARRESLPPPQPIAMDEEDEDLPEWKQKLLYQKRLRATAEVRAKKQAERDEEERFLGFPEWKVKLIKKKEAERAVMEESEREQQAERHERRARIAAMPEWKRKLYMAKNPMAWS